MTEQKSLFLDTDFEEVQITPQPVTCLGMTFESDEARRAYFREELRKKLPELRKIEGFPIGEDDDIINLSDPPYYTACPNPWLNDFIELWEKEKVELEMQGKRNYCDLVKQPYAYGIKQGKNSAIYNAHSYHTKVPHEVIMRYILHYTQPGDIVLDSFAGTGMTGVAATLCGKVIGTTKSDIEADFKENGYKTPKWGSRHSICGDLSPLCLHISSNYNDTVDTKSLKKCVDEILSKLNERFGHFYQIDIKNGNTTIKAHVNYCVWSQIVACKNCGHELNVHDLSFDYNTKKLHDKLMCPSCGTIQARTEANSINETIYDEDINDSVSQLKYRCCLLNYNIPKRGRYFSTNIIEPEYPEYIGFIPTYTFGEGDKFGDPKRVGAYSVNQLYYKRTKYVLAYLYHIIHKDYISFEKPLMFIFTSMLPKLTRMNRYMPQHGSRALVGPMANTLYIPPQGVENNPIDQFEYQAGKVIRAFEQCSTGCVVQLCSATHSSLRDESIDYIFTDPPFGANIMYSELNTISESWLRVMTNNREEAISNKTQHKGLPEYQKIMEACFKEYYRVLKYGKWMTVEFSNTSASFWNCLQYAIKGAGFVIAAITDLNKERGGLHAMLGPTAVKQDLAISCYKPSESVIKKIALNSDNSVWNLVNEHLEHITRFSGQDNKTVYITERDPRIIYDRIVSYYVQHGYAVPIDAIEFQKGLKERFIERDGMYFTASQALEYEEKRAKSDGFVPMALFIGSEADGIEWLKRKLETPKTYQELQPDWMKDLVAPKKGDVLPGLDVILEENFIKGDDGKWSKPDPENASHLEQLRGKRMMKEFNIYLEAAKKPKAKRMKDTRLEVLRYGFKDCYKQKNYQDIVTVGEHIPESLLMEDEILLQYYDIAVSRV